MHRFFLHSIFWLCVLSANAQQPIDKKEFFEIGGIKQSVWLKGDNDSKPLLLFLHGGPGNSVIAYANKFCDQLYKHFVVVHWDQRDAGETLRKNVSPLPLTLSLYQKDALAMVDSLLKRMNQKNLILAGHSWGTALGFHIVRKKPSSVKAFFAIGTMVNQLQSERIALVRLKEKASQSNNDKMLTALDEIAIPFGSGDQLFYHRSGLMELNGKKPTLTKAYVNQWAEKWLELFNEASKENLFESLPEIECPVYFIAGRQDYQTNSLLVEQYFKVVKAPDKEFHWIENAGHSIPSTHGRTLQEIILKHCR